MSKSKYKHHMVIEYYYELDEYPHTDEYLTWVDPELVKEINKTEKGGMYFNRDEWEGVFLNLFDGDTSDWDNFEVTDVDPFKMRDHKHLVENRSTP